MDSQDLGEQEQKGHLRLENKLFLKNRTEPSLENTSVSHRYGNNKQVLHGNVSMLIYGCLVQQR